MKNMQNKAYAERLKCIANIGILEINSDIKFIPSWNIKNKEIFTETTRRYIGVLTIDSKEYLTYYISLKKEDLYIKQLMFDIKKAVNYDDVIIFVDQLDVISKKYNNLSLGKDNIVIVLNDDYNKELLKKYYNQDIHDVLENMYSEEILISNWKYADYMLEDNTYIITMPFINTERLERLNWFCKENDSIKRNIEIITTTPYKNKILEIININCKIKTFDENFTGGRIEI